MSRQNGLEVWEDRLASADVPADVAVYFAQWGDAQQRGTLASNPAAPLEAQLILADDADEEVARCVLANWEASTEIVSRLIDRFPDSEEAITHPQAPLACKLRLPVFKLATYSLSLFLDAVRATAAERQRLHTTAERFNYSITLGDAWRQTRTDRWPRPSTSDEGDSRERR